LAGVCSGARYWQALGAPSTATIVTIWSSGPGHWSLRSTVGFAASLTVGPAMQPINLTVTMNELSNAPGASVPLITPETICGGRDG